MIDARHLDQVLLSDDPEDPMEIAKEFDAVCWCAAQQVFAKHQGHEPYDMWDCKGQEKRGRVDQCLHYTEQRIWLDQRLKKLRKKLRKKIKRLRARLRKLEAR